METDFSRIDDNYKRILFNIREAEEKYRKSGGVSLIAVTKTVDPAAVNHAVSLGIRLLGENRVQEYISKKDFYDRNAVDNILYFICLQMSDKMYLCIFIIKIFF